MPKAKCHINIEVDEKQRDKFKNIVRQKGIRVQQAIPLLMQKVIDGEISFAPIETRLVINQKKR